MRLGGGGREGKELAGLGGGGGIEGVGTRVSRGGGFCVQGGVAQPRGVLVDGGKQHSLGAVEYDWAFPDPGMSGG